MADALLQIKGISKSFGDLRVLDDVHATIAAGEIVAVQGASGTGKSTLLNIIGLLDTADTGSIHLGSRCINSGLSHQQQAQIRGKEIGFIFQAYHLLPEFNVLENILMPIRCLGLALPDYERRAMVLLEQVGLAARAKEMPLLLSGGERQRIAVCRALIHSPQLILADEPTGNLDPETTQHVLEQLVNLVRETQSSVLMVSHDPLVCARADRLLTLRQHALNEA